MAIKYHEKYHKFAVALVVIAVASVGVLFVYLKMARKFSSIQVKIEQLSAKDTEGMSYIVTYLIPFLDLKIEDPNSAVALFCLFGVVGILYVNSNMIYINPVLNLFGFHLFEIETSSKKKEALLTRKSFIAPGTTIKAVALGNLVMLEC